MSIVAPIVATSAIVPVLCGRASTASGPARCSGSGSSPRWPAWCWPPASPAGRPRTRKLALKLALVAALGIGLSLVFLDRAAEHDALTGVAAARAVAAPILLARRPRSSAPARRWRAGPTFALVGLLDTGANTAFAIATTSGLLSLVAVLGGLFPVVTVALAYFLLHERLQPVQRAGRAARAGRHPADQHLAQNPQASRRSASGSGGERWRP